MSNDAGSPRTCSEGVSYTPSSPPAPKARSCAVCRSRRVRCDKQQPRCGNCQKANIPCVLPPRDRQPRWARRLERFPNTSGTANAPSSSAVDLNVDKVMDRVHNLESLVKELRGQLEQARTSGTSVGTGQSSGSSPASSSQHRETDHQPAGSSPGTDNGSVHSQLGRLVLQDSSRSHYVTGGFWSRIDDELDALKMDIHDPAAENSGSADDDELSHAESSVSKEVQYAPNRPTWLFSTGQEPSPSDVHDLHPLPSQIPFVVEVFCENVNWILHAVHIPTITQMFRDVRSRGVHVLSPNQEALAFSIYYAAVASMEEDEVLLNFGASKTELTRSYQIGLDHALGEADFLGCPNLTNITALSIYLCLARRNENPRHVWMLVGLLIRMATFIGLQRDGSQFGNLSPFEIEMRRRTWWVVVILDLKAAEDQGTEPAIPSGSFDTRLPLNLNDVDITPDTKETPQERVHITDVTPLRIQAGVCNVSKQMMALSGQEWAAMDDQNHLVNEIYRKFELEYFRFVTDPNNPAYATANVVARLVMSKMTLIAFLPVLVSSSSEHLSHEIRTKLLIAAIEVAEYNHTLNAEPLWKRWRWVYQTHTHWYAIVFMMIELSRRPWSPIVERGWTVLHSNWLFPVEARTGKSKTLRIWVPLRKLMAKVRKHRVEELERLRNNPQEVYKLQIEDENIPLPASAEPFSGDGNFRERWRKLFPQPQQETQTFPTASTKTVFPNGQYQPSPLNATASYTEVWQNTSIPDVWTGNGASFDEFLNMDLDSWDAGMDWNDEMNWYSWTQTARNMETGGMDWVEGFEFGGR